MQTTAAENEELPRWLGGISKPSTRSIYEIAFKAYSQFTGFNASQLLDEAEKDQTLSTRQRKDIIKQRLIQFQYWLVTEYQVKSRGRGTHRILHLGLAPKSAAAFVGAIRSFYSTFGFNVKFTGASRLSNAPARNKRLRLTGKQVKQLVDSARSLRDKAIILTMFQAGFDVSTACSLTYGHISQHLTNKEQPPWKLDVMRLKTGVVYYTFIGRDAIEALKVYITDMQSKGVEFTDRTKLFLKERGKVGMTTNLVQIMLKDIALRVGFIDANMNGNDINPAGPHALRESFSSLMKNAGVERDVVNLWIGHDIGELTRVYQEPQFDYVKRLYVENEHLVSISESQDGTQLRDEFEKKLEVFKKQVELARWTGDVMHGYRSGEFSRTPEQFIAQREAELGRKMTDDEKIEYLMGLVERPETKYHTQLFQNDDGSDNPVLERKLSEIRSTGKSSEDIPEKQKQDIKQMSEIVDEESLQKRLDEGWEIQMVLSSGKIVVRR